jgi:type II secretory pathway component PulK
MKCLNRENFDMGMQANAVPRTRVVDHRAIKITAHVFSPPLVLRGRDRVGANGHLSANAPTPALPRSTRGGRKTAARRVGANRRGTILIVALGILLIIAGLVVTLGRSMSVEAQASANYAASVQASAVERGAEQYVIGMLIQLQQENETFYDLPDSDFAAVKIGDGYFWIVRPTYPNDPEFSQYGLVDEAAKLNLNYTDETQLMGLTGDITQDMADAVLDWAGEDGGVDNSSYYGALPTPYQDKKEPFESVEELLLVNGFTRELLYGQSMATAPAPTIGLGQNNAMQSPTLNTDPEAVNGIADFLTVYSASGGGGATAAPGTATPAAATSTPGKTGTTVTPTASAGAKINVNAAPYEVLVALLSDGGDGNAEGDASSIIASRSLDDLDDGTVLGLMGQAGTSVASKITGNNLFSQFSADIVAVSANGRAFKRVKVVIDASQTTPTIIYRRDITTRGWPLDTEILTNLRAGQPVPDAQDISEVGSSI